MSKDNRYGKAAIISDSDYSKIRSCIRSKKYKLLLDIARFTGERWGAILELSVSDIYTEDGRVKDTITFRVRVGIATKTKTRSVLVHPRLRELLEVYRHECVSCWLFPSRDDLSHPISLRAADKIFRAAVERADLSHKGYSTFSTRLTFVNCLYSRGVDIPTIARLAGYSDLKTLVSHLKENPQRITHALALL